MKVFKIMGSRVSMTIQLSQDLSQPSAVSRMSKRTILLHILPSLTHGQFLASLGYLRMRSWICSERVWPRMAEDVDSPSLMQLRPVLSNQTLAT